MYDVSNLTDGYVSHSFNQFIKADEGGKYIYRVCLLYTSINFAMFSDNNRNLKIE